MYPTSFYSPRSLSALFLSLLLSVSLILAPIQRARAEFLSTSLGGILAFRASGAALGSAAATFVGTGGAALVGVGLTMAAVYIYDKYVSGNATSKPSGTPVAQVNIDNQSRLLTDEERSMGFTNNNALGQAVIPPSSSVAYPPLWSGTGSATNPGVNGKTCAEIGVPVGGWATTTTGLQFYAQSPGLPAPSRGVGYENPTTLGFYCVVDSKPHTIWTTGNRCAAGYGGANCTLQNVTNIVLPQDGVCQILRNGNAFSVDNRDPDCTPKPGQSNPLPTFIGTGNGTLSFISKPDSNGRPAVATIDIKNGQSDIVIAIPNITTPTYTNNTVSAAVPSATTGAAVVTTVTQTNTTGVGAGAGAAVSNPATTGDITVEVDLPPNLAKTEDVAAVKNAIDELKVAPSDPFTPDPGITIPDVTEAIKSTVGDGSSLPSIFSFSPTLPSSVTAPNISFNLAGSPVTMDINSWIGYLRNFLGVLLYVLTPFTIFSIISGRREE